MLILIISEITHILIYVVYQYQSIPKIYIIFLTCLLDSKGIVSGSMIFLPEKKKKNPNEVM